MKRQFYKLLTIALSVVLLSPLLYAGTTGKIVGVVKDKETGERLMGVTVIVVGTTLGAATDVNGEFFINNVPVGTYTVQASMVGYQSVRVENVQISADLTTTVNFELSSKAVEVAPITVTAERPLVQKELTATTKITTSTEITKMPLRTANAVVLYTAGVQDENTFRGAGGISWMVDGLQTKDPLSGARSITLNNIAVEEVQVITGGFSAEYGEAMSGVVNIVTRSGGPVTSAFYRLTTDAGMKVFDKKLDFGYYDHELSLGGPLPLTDGKLRYFVSAVLALRGSANARRLDNLIGQLSSEGYDMSAITSRWPKTADNPYFLPHDRQQRYEATWKLSYNPISAIKLNLAGIVERNQWEDYPWDATSQTPARSYLFVLDQYTAYRRNNFQIWAGITHQVSPTTFYDLKITRYETNLYSGLKDIYLHNPDGSIMRDSLGTPIIDKDNSWWQDYKFVPAKYDTTVKSVAQYNYTDYRDQDWTNPHNPFGVYNNWQAGGASTRRYEERLLSYWGVKLDFTSQVTKVHQLKAGFEFRRHNAERHYNSLPWRPDPFQDNYIVNPNFFFAYIQDMAEWPGLIVNAGFRLDYFAPQRTHRVDPLDRFSQQVSTDAKWQISPRLGISHPITEKTVIHLQYGQFFQFENFFNVYQNLDPYTSRWYDVVGNPDLRPQKTIAYELGVVHQIGLNSRLEVVAFYKDLYDLVGTRFIPVAPYPITQVDNRTYAMSQGVEFSFHKRFSDNWATDISYTISRNKGMAFSSQADFLRQRINPETGLQYAWPEKLFPGGQRDHMIRLNFDYRVPEGGGPEVFNIRPLENFGINALFIANSGFRYTRRNYRGEALEEYGASEGPWYYNLDLRINRDFRIFDKYMLSIFAEIYNVLNTEQILGLYEITGDPLLVGDERLYSEANFTKGIDRLQPDGTENPNWRWEKVKDLDGDGHITAHEEYLAFMKSFLFLRRTPSNYGPPRQVRVGLQFYF